MTTTCKYLDFQSNKSKAQDQIHKPDWQIQTKLVHRSKQGSIESQTSLSLPWAWHSSAPAELVLSKFKLALYIT